MVRRPKRPRLWSDYNSSSESDSERAPELPPAKKGVKQNCCFFEHTEVSTEPVRSKRSKGECKEYRAPSAGREAKAEHVDKSRYERWNCKVDTAEYLPWYRSRELVCALRCIRKINYSDGRARCAALDRLNKLNDAAPFSRHKRFPDNFYILEGGGPVAKRLQQLRCVLELRDVPSCPPADRKECSAENMCKIFRNCCRMLMSELVKGEDIYDRKKFEKTFEVLWTESSSKPGAKPKASSSGSRCPAERVKKELPPSKKCSNDDKSAAGSGGGGGTPEKSDDDERDDPCKRCGK